MATFWLVHVQLEGFRMIDGNQADEEALEVIRKSITDYSNRFDNLGKLLYQYGLKLLW